MFHIQISSSKVNSLCLVDTNLLLEVLLSKCKIQRTCTTASYKSNWLFGQLDRVPAVQQFKLLDKRNERIVVRKKWP